MHCVVTCSNLHTRKDAGWEAIFIHQGFSKKTEVIKEIERRASLHHAQLASFRGSPAAEGKRAKCVFAPHTHAMYFFFFALVHPV